MKGVLKMNGKSISVLIAIAFGIVLFWLGWGAAVSVLLLGIGGWFIGKLVSGEIDISSYLDSLSRRRTSRQ